MSLPNDEFRTMELEVVAAEALDSVSSFFPPPRAALLAVARSLEERPSIFDELVAELGEPR